MGGQSWADTALYGSDILLKSFKCIIFIIRKLSLHYKHRNQNKSEKTKSWNKLECEADVRCLQISTESNC